MPRLFGTNGVRGEVNKDMNINLGLKLGMAMGTYASGGRVAIGTDTRTSREMLKSAVSSGLMATGSSVIDLDVVPTPVVQYYVKHNDVALGCVITASHNPPRFNGIKCIDADGTELSRESEEKIEALYFNGAFKEVSWDLVGNVARDTESTETYMKGIMDNIDLKATKKSALRVVLDLGNGAGSRVSPYLLERMGCRVITLNAQPAGTFPGHESEPTPENLSDLIETVKGSGADLGIAHDGDADRTIAIDEKGNYLFGDRILALVAREMLRENGGGLIITTVASSLALEDVVKKHNGTIIYTKVGSPIVARKMMATNAIFGGEENGGLIFPRHQYCRDGAMAAAKLVEILARTQRPLSQLISELPTYHLYKTKVECPHGKKEPALLEFAKAMKGKNVDLTDGVKILLKRAWVLVRPSGTEPIYRIFAEAESPDTARLLAEESRNTIMDIIKRMEG